MYKRGDREFVLDMLIACRKILEYTEGMRFEDFLRDERTIDAVVRNLEILGEASKKVSPELKEKYPEIEWSIIARTRDKLIHFYFGVDVGVLWATVRDDIPELERKLEGVIWNEGWQDDL